MVMTMISQPQNEEAAIASAEQFAAAAARLRRDLAGFDATEALPDLHELAARLRAARASVETAHDWSRDLARRTAGESELAGA